MKCHHCRKLIPLLLEGQTPAGHLAEHLAGCAACASEWNRLQQQETLLHAALKPQAVPPGLTERILGAWKQPAPQPVRLSWQPTRWRAWGWGLAAAMGVLLVTAEIIFFSQQGSRVPGGGRIETAAKGTEGPPASGWRLRTIQGPVHVCEPGQASWQPAHPGAALQPGSRVQVEGDGWVRVELDRGCALTLRNGARVELRAGRVDLTQGQLQVSLPGAEDQLLVETPAARVEAAEAELTVGVTAADQTTEVTVQRGSATVVNAQGLLKIEAGQRAEVQSGEAPALAGDTAHL